MSPGFALSPRGEEIVVGESVSQALACPANPRFVAIRYDERLVDPVPDAGRIPGDNTVQFTAVEETYVLEIFEAGLHPPDDPWVVLGAVACDQNGHVRIDTSGRQLAKECR